LHNLHHLHGSNHHGDIINFNHHPSVIVEVLDTKVDVEEDSMVVEIIQHHPLTHMTLGSERYSLEVFQKS